MNPEIIELTKEISILTGQISNTAFFAVGGVFFGILLCGCMAVYLDFKESEKLLFLIIPIILISTGVYYIIDVESINYEINLIKEERDTMFDSEIISMSCDNLRLLLLDILKGQHDDYITEKSDWIEKYYYLHCETPLRDEVMKLQGLR